MANFGLPLSPKFTKIFRLVRNQARMVESVDTRDLKSLSFGSVGSSPSPGTTKALSEHHIISFINGEIAEKTGFRVHDQTRRRGQSG